VCGGDVVLRDDDTEEAINRRLDLYERETAPLIAWFDKWELLVEVNGTGTLDDVTDRLVQEIDRRREL
jgi:adenylate kinase